MGTWRGRLLFGVAFFLVSQAFDVATEGFPYTPFYCLLYYGSAATGDLLIFHSVKFFLKSYLKRDIEALCIASICINAFGLAVVFLAEAPPYFYDLLISGVTYVLAIRLFMGDGNVLDRINISCRYYWRSVVLRHWAKSTGRMAEKEEG